MSGKLLGAVLVFAACAALGLLRSSAYGREARVMHQLSQCLDRICWELQYQPVCLDQLCVKAAKSFSGPIGKVMDSFQRELSRQICPDTDQCMQAAMYQCPELPDSAGQILAQFAGIIGKFDLTSQLESLRACCAACKRRAEELDRSKLIKMRNCKAFGFCMGAMAAILLL